MKINTNTMQALWEMRQALAGLVIELRMEPAPNYVLDALDFTNEQLKEIKNDDETIGARH